MADQQDHARIDEPVNSVVLETNINNDDSRNESSDYNKEHCIKAENKDVTMFLKSAMLGSDDEEYELNRLTPSIEKAIRHSILSISQESSSDSDNSDETKEEVQKKKRKRNDDLLDEDSNLNCNVDLDNFNDKNDVFLDESKEVQEPEEKKLKLDETEEIQHNSQDRYLEMLTNSQKIRKFLDEQYKKFGCKTLRVKLFKPDQQMKLLIKKLQENKENINPDDIKPDSLEQKQGINFQNEGNTIVIKESNNNIEENIFKEKIESLLVKKENSQKENNHYINYEFLESSKSVNDTEIEDIQVKSENLKDDESSSEDDSENEKLKKHISNSSRYRAMKSKSVLRFMSDSDESDVEMAEDLQPVGAPVDNSEKNLTSYFSDSSASSKSSSDTSFFSDSNSDAEMGELNEKSGDEEGLDRKLLLKPTADHSSRGLGEKALETLHHQRELTVERIQDLHGSLVSRPLDTEHVQDPQGLYTPLMLHQQQALAWLLWREQQKPPGGILADDMGLGKTLTMISLVLARHQDAEKRKETEKNKKRRFRYSKYRGGTLVVCPASLLNQWENEVYGHCHADTLTVEVFHGNNREKSIKKLASKDIVITTYNILARANTQHQSNLFKIHWDRVILDEAHVIRNHKAQMCVSVCQLITDNRWALTGTPIHNKQMDLFSLLKFLQCSPFDDIKVWRRWVDNKDEAGYHRLTTLMKTLLLRRTKKELIAKGQIESLPEKFVEEIPIELDAEEKLVYEKVMLFSRSIFAEFLHQRQKKKKMFDLGAAYYAPSSSSSYASYKGFNKAQIKLLASHADIQAYEILVLLMRLRQICCHPSLIHAMLDQESMKQDGINSIANFDLINQINTFKLTDNDTKVKNEDGEENDEDDDEELGISSTRVTENLLTSKNPVFDPDRQSSKHRAILERITKIFENNPNDKIIIVSQWTAHLEVIAKNLDSIEGATYKKYTGAVAIKNRHKVVTEFNKAGEDPRILLLSLTAGGVGLNLIGANHVMIVDVHWNPQLESQAQDRVYRFGQKKNVSIYKFICTDTIEEKIKDLQEYKLQIAQNVLTGTCQVSSKLTLEDMKSLFSL